MDKQICGYTIKSTEIGGWYALLPNETEFNADTDNYLGFFSSEKDLLEELAVRLSDNMDDFTKAYAVAALWSSTDDDGNPLDNRTITASTLLSFIEDCQDFQKNHGDLLEKAYAQREGYYHTSAGHDFWLTRNRHGAGYWDRGLGLVGTQLTQAAHAYGEVNLFVNEDGEVYS